MSDLWVVEFDDEKFADQGYHAFSWGDMRKASPADLLSAVRSLEGVEEVHSREEPMWNGPRDVLPVSKPGRYLVVPLGLEEEN